MAQVDAIIRKEYGIDPETLNYTEWCKLYAEWQFVNKINHENQKAAILDAAAEIFKAINPEYNGFSNNTMDS